MKDTHIKMVSYSILVVAMSLSWLVWVPSASAAVATWQRGASIYPSGSNTDFASDNFKQSVTNLKNTGATYVSLVVPYYQSNTGSTDINPGWNTPTDDSLRAGIDYAHSIGLAVAIKVHIESYTGEWRAHINPGDRATWFARYGDRLVHVGTIGKAHNVEMIVLGTELVSMATYARNGSNTQNWIDMIGRVRGVYTGKLAYDANSNNNNDDVFSNEKKFIGFWSSLDYVGLSTYYTLGSGDNSVDAIKSQWDYWNKNDIMAFAERVGKPILLSEVGYRSIGGARFNPWDSGRGGGYDGQEQANLYEALLSYWNDYPYVQGVYWWDWQVNPNAGGPGDTSYTPQRKPAEEVMKKWFKTPSAPSGGGTTGGAPALTSSAAVSPASPAQGSSTTITATIHNIGGSLSAAIVDIEIYQGGAKVFQKFYEGETLSAGADKAYTATWTAGAPGTYTIHVGVFAAGWSQLYAWNAAAGQITVVAGAGGGTTAPPPGTSAGPQVTEVWWPTSGATVSGLQTFKILVQNLALSQYRSFWQVDTGVLNPMYDSQTDYPHKEALVDLSGWHWKPSGDYTLTFTSKDTGGTTISQKSVGIHVP